MIGAAEMIENVQRIFGKCAVCGRTHPLVTREVCIEKGATERLISYIGDRGAECLVVCDGNTEKYARRIAGGARCGMVTLPAGAHATEVTVDMLRERASHTRCALMVACGSGSLHDTVRYFAHEKGIPFISYPTAASVDGFVSGVAAMTWHSQKLTFPAVPPVALFADDDVYADAPARLTASGAADMLGKYTALLDWRAAHILIGEPLCERIYALEKEALDEITHAVLHRSALDDAAYTKLIMNGLILSGLAMQLQENSRPASGAEHHLSHFWEMHLSNPECGALHGEQVGVGLLYVLDAYKSFLSRDTLLTERFLHPDLERVFDTERLRSVFDSLTDGILHENMPAGQESCSLAQLRLLPDEAEAELRRAVGALPSREDAERLLRACGAPASLSELGLPEEEAFIRKSVEFAPYVRNRLTLLKLIAAEHAVW